MAKTKIYFKGQEYEIDEQLLAEAAAAIQERLVALSGGSEEPSAPVKNEYGFYYNVLYESESEGYDPIMFCEDGYFYECFDEDGKLYNGADKEYTYDEATRTADVRTTGRAYTFSEDGNTCTLVDDEIGSIVYTANPAVVVQLDQPLYGVEYEYEGTVFIFNEDGTATVDGEDVTYRKLEKNSVYIMGHFYTDCLFSLDGTAIYAFHEGE